MNYNDLLEPLPEKLAVRLRGLAGFIRTVLEEEQAKLSAGERLASGTLNEIQFVIILIYLIELLKESSKAASSAATVFGSMGVSGFQIGSQTFTSKSKESRIGQEMADELSAILGKIDLPETLTTAEGPGKLTRELFGWVKVRG